MKRTRHRRKASSGAAILELAILIPLLIMMAMGIIEFGRGMVVQSILTNAAREGGRRAAISGASHNVALAAIDDYLANEGITGHTPTIVPNADTVPKGDPITVTVSVPYTSVDYGRLTWLGDNTLSAQVVMRKE
ncbi:MAG: pilus assembly protein [Planctomycetota bacterium]|nr:pilus assembly protein [Planctomycetota bacterium]